MALTQEHTEQRHDVDRGVEPSERHQPPEPRRRSARAVAGWAAVGALVAATAVLAAQVLRSDDAARSSPGIFEFGSPRSLDHASGENWGGEMSTGGILVHGSPRAMDYRSGVVDAVGGGILVQGSPRAMDYRSGFDQP